MSIIALPKHFSRLQDLNDVETIAVEKDGYVYALDWATGRFELVPLGGAVAWGEITGTLADQTDLQTALDGKAPLAGVTGDFSVGETLSVDQINFDLTPTETMVPGSLQWDATHETLQVLMPRENVTLQIGQENHLPPTKAGEALTDGDLVYISGATGSNVTVMKAKADAFGTSWVAGMATEPAALNGFLKVTIFGAVHNLNTTGIAEGAAVWLSPTTAGAYTATRPTAPDMSVFVGFCIREHANQGVIVVRPDLVPRMQGLSDVYVSSLVDNQILKYVAAESRFENVDYVPGQDLSGLTDEVLPIADSGSLIDSGYSWDVSAQSASIDDTSAHNLLDLKYQYVSIGGGVAGLMGLSIGYDSSTGTNSIAYGRSAKAAGSNSGALLRSSNVTGDNSIGVGYSATVTGDMSGAFGPHSRVNADEGFSIGYYLLSDHANAVAIGSGVNGTFFRSKAANSFIYGDQGKAVLEILGGTSTVNLYRQSSLGNDLKTTVISPSLIDDTEASYKSRLSLIVQDYAAEREALRIDSDGSTVTSEVFGFQSFDGCFAEIHLHNNSTAQTIPTGATYTKFTLWGDNGLSSHCTSDVANDKITFTKPGIYKIIGSFNFSCDTNNIDFLGTAFFNGVEQDHVHFERRISTAADIGSASFTGLIDVTAASLDLDFRVRHSGAGDVDFTLGYGNLNVEYVGKT